MFSGEFKEVRIRSYNNAVRMMVGDINAVRNGGGIVMHVGEGYPKIFNRPEFLEAARGVVRERGASIQVTAGPVLLIPEMGTENGLRVLQKEGVVELRIRPVRFLHTHTRVVETDEPPYRVYEEATNGRFLYRMDFRDVAYRDFDEYRGTRPDKVEGEVQDKLRSFDYWWTWRSGFEPPLLTTERGLRKLISEGEGMEPEGKSYEYMDADELLALPSASKFLRRADD